MVRWMIAAIVLVVLGVFAVLFFSMPKKSSNFDEEPVVISIRPSSPAIYRPTVVPTKPVVTPELITIQIYFSNPEKTMGSTVCGVVLPVDRKVLRTADMATVSLHELLQGPTETEKDEGYTSFFSEKTANSLNSVNVIGSTAYVNFKDIQRVIPNASASCGSQQFLNEILWTLRKNTGVTRVLYAINGDPKVFWEWLQFGCSAENDNCDATNFKN